MQYAYLIWSLILLFVWGLVYFLLRKKDSRREMLAVSLCTPIFGLTEPFFVPEYWNPPTLFNLASRTGFDLESFIFGFAAGGLAVVIYELFFPIGHEEMSPAGKHEKRHHYHLLALLSAPLIFFATQIFTDLNPIYSTFLAFLGGGLFTWYCRPDLKKKMFASALIFLVLYFLYFLTLVLMYPNYVERVWNLPAISGILILGIPLEELIFGLGLGFMWSSVYEHLAWRRIKTFNES